MVLSGGEADDAETAAQPTNHVERLPADGPCASQDDDTGHGTTHVAK
jgi:hypothetical protein